jgi:hypothetical protein
MKKEDWINNILESASEIKESEPNPYLYSKILNRINQTENKTRPGLKYKLRWVAAISLVIAINVSAFFIYKLKIHKQNEAIAIESLSNEMISNTTYNY